MMIKILNELRQKYGIKLDDLWNGVLYLKKYGYLDNIEADKKTFCKAVKLYQKFFHLKEDGSLGPKSLHAMRAPRCSVPDCLASTTRKWTKKELRYYVDGFVTGLNRSTQASLMRLAWASWAKYIDLKFIRTNNVNRADILVGVGRGQRYGFDGAGGVLAWAQLPPGNNIRLRCRFDLDETWIKDVKYRGILFLNVAAHEFGHLLGLTHSHKENTLMAPFYNPVIDDPQLDDVTRIQDVYGKFGTPTPKPKPSDPKPIHQIVTIKVDGTVKDVKVENE
jgi:hypothetical protein